MVNRLSPEIVTALPDQDLMTVLAACLQRARRLPETAPLLRSYLSSLESQAAKPAVATGTPAAEPVRPPSAQAFEAFQAGQQAFACGEPLHGWTDTPFAAGWLAAARGLDGLR